MDEIDDRQQQAESAAAVATVAVATTVDERCCGICCLIISGRYSHHEKLQTLKKVYKGVATHAQGGDFLKSFHAYGGISSVLTFLIKTMYDGNCVGANRMECIKYAALIIGNATDPGENNVNEDIAKEIVTSIMECDGINPLIAASEEYSGGDDIPQLNALDSVWYALRNISCRMDEMKDLISKDQAIALFDTGNNTISHLKSVDYPQASSTVEHIYSTFLNIENKYNMGTVTRADIRDTNVPAVKSKSIGTGKLSAVPTAKSLGTGEIVRTGSRKSANREQIEGSDQPTKQSALEAAIEAGDWDAVGEAAALLTDTSIASSADTDEINQFADGASTDGSSAAGSKNLAEVADELEELIEAGDWTGVVQAASGEGASNSEKKTESTETRRLRRLKHLQEEQEALAQAEIWSVIAEQSKQEAETTD